MAVSESKRPGVVAGGTTGQLLAKNSNTNYDTEWIDPPNSAVWGGISGTITNQTDLIAYLSSNYLAMANFATAFNTVLATKTTSDLSEGSNLYFTDARARAAAVSDVAYDATSWDGVTDIAPSKNAIRDKIETLVSSLDDVVDTVAYTYYGGL